MLNTFPVTPTLAVTDINRAREFYGPKLGLKEEPGYEPDEAMFQCGNGTRLYVYKRPTTSGSTATSCSFEVRDVEKTVKDLRAKGLRFEEYNMPGLKTVNGIAKMGQWKSAWFKDPDGNIIAVGQRLK